VDDKLSIKKYCQQVNSSTNHQQFTTKYFQLVNIKYCQHFNKSAINIFNQSIILIIKESP